MTGRSIVAISLFLILGTSLISAQAGIKGRLVLDSTVWAPVVYLSHIADLDQLHAISHRQIIARAELEPDGTFFLSTEMLPESDHLYRIHLVKKGDPPATLMIGGREHNHFFLVAKQGCEVVIGMSPGITLFNNLYLAGYGPNNSLQEIEAVIARLQAVDQVATSINRDFTREVIFDQLRAMADSSRHPLTSLYALQASNYKEHLPGNHSYYRRYLNKWRSEKSEYFIAFRQQLDMDRGILSQILFAGLGLLLLILILTGLYIWKGKMNTNPYADLTVQERRVFDLLREGRSNKEIAEEFSVSVSTVKSHVNSIFSKLGVKSRRDIMNM